MRRALRRRAFNLASKGVAVAFVAAGLASCGGAATPTDPQYSLEQCRRVAIYNAVDGALITGAEDMAIDRKGARLFISAYDRRASEKAARNKAAAIPQGGVYAVAISDILNARDNALSIRPMVQHSEVGGGLRPHGLTFDEAAGEVVFINRSYQRINHRWRMTPRIERIGAYGEAFMGRSEKAPCAANDIVSVAGRTLTSFDHGDCNWRAGLEDVFALKRSGVAGGDDVLFEKARFANGLTRTLGGELVVAATREKALLVMKENAAALEPGRRIALPGGPDNLTLASDGGVVAAVHPSLMKMGMHRKLGIGRAPSRIVKADTDNGRVTLLYDDPKGALFTAATVAVEWDDALIAGSVTDSGVLVCQKT